MAGCEVCYNTRICFRDAQVMEKLKPNDQIGVYRIIRPLGKGGMGAVYEVVHTKLGVHYALKTFTLDHGHVKLLKERFLAEGRILARLRHPNLVRVFDLDVEESTNTPYFVMDLVQYKDGTSHTLADLEPGGADEEHLARWLVQLCSALDYIHAAGIVHRDIKLGNILLDAQGGVVLSDFGVSRFSSKALRRELDLERTVVSGDTVTGNLVMGTSGYMAPEVKRGEDATAAADAYSLGVVFFRLLTGVWYENRSNIFGLLDPFEAAWQDLLPRLLAENPEERVIPLLPAAQKVADAVGISVAESAPVVPVYTPSAPGGEPAGPQAKSRLPRLLAASLLAAVLIGGAVLTVMHFMKDDELRVDDLYGIPSTVAGR